MSPDLRVTIAGVPFPARFEPAAPLTRAAFEQLLPHADRLIHARWSGEACWVPLGDRDFGLAVENPLAAPQPGQLLFYPGGISEAEILIPYGPSRFACRAGALAGSHFLTLGGDLDRMAALGRDTLWTGAADIRFETA
ncbi:MAG: hypothetical protein JWR84_2976 [Caulobacter sp.]|nr:hypothetical protein [Caulobacter sp.]